MRAAAEADVGDAVSIELAYDPTPRSVPMPPTFAAALAGDSKARTAFENLTPSHRKDILSYLNSLKTEESLKRTSRRRSPRASPAATLAARERDKPDGHAPDTVRRTRFANVAKVHRRPARDEESRRELPRSPPGAEITGQTASTESEPG